MKWLKSTLTKLWRWFFPEAKAMVVNSRIAVQIRENSVNSEAGDIIEVMPANYEPTIQEKYLFLWIDSERTVAENKELVKSGVPDSVRSAWEAEDERVRTEILAEIAKGKSKGLTDAEIKTNIGKNSKCVFDPAKKIDHDAHPHRRFGIDLTAVPSTTLARIEAAHDLRVSVKSECDAKEKQRVLEKYAEQKGRALTDAEKQKTTREIVNEYTIDEAMVAASQADIPAGAPLSAVVAKVSAGSAVADADKKKNEILAASASGRDEVLLPALEALDAPQSLALTIDELAPIIIQK